MKKEYINIAIVGEAGQGIGTFTRIFSNVFLNAGYHVYSYRNFTTRVKGGINWGNLTLSNERLGHVGDDLDILISMKDGFEDEFKSKLKPKGIIIRDGEEEGFRDGVLTLPLTRLAKGTGSIRNINSVILGAIMGLFNLELAMAHKKMLKEFSAKGIEIYDENLKALQLGHKYTIDKEYIKVFNTVNTRDRILVSGCNGIVLAAVGSGCQLLYTKPLPITIEFMDQFREFTREFPIITDSCESDRSALYKSLGSNYAGVKSMVVTTSTGFQKLYDALSFAGMAELPVVLTTIQFPGPSVGLPTKTSQSDLLSIIFSGNDDFPRVIYSPANHDECYSLTIKAFEVSHNYNIPVIILLDHYLAKSYSDIELFDVDEVRRPRDHFTRKQLGKVKEYSTYKNTKDGVSPRLYPGSTKFPVIVNSYEHDELGMISDCPENRIKMHEKRNRKADAVLNEYLPPEFYGKEKFKTLFVAWGSTIEPVKTVVDILNSKKGKVGALLFSQVYPLNPKKIKKYFKRTKFIVDVETNYSGQFASLLREVGSFEVDAVINRYDGLPITAEYILEKFNKLEKK